MKSLQSLLVLLLLPFALCHGVIKPKPSNPDISRENYSRKSTACQYRNAYYSTNNSVVTNSVVNVTHKIKLEHVTKR
jgi:hypothetical protein